MSILLIEKKDCRNLGLSWGVHRGAWIYGRFDEWHEWALHTLISIV